MPSGSRSRRRGKVTGCQDTEGSKRKLILYFFSGGIRLRRRIQLKNSLMPEELRNRQLRDVHPHHGQVLAERHVVHDFEEAGHEVARAQLVDLPGHDRWCRRRRAGGPCRLLPAPLRSALRTCWKVGGVYTKDCQKSRAICPGWDARAAPPCSRECTSAYCGRAVAYGPGSSGQAVKTATALSARRRYSRGQVESFRGLRHRHTSCCGELSP